jgi:hypothetical protein
MCAFFSTLSLLKQWYRVKVCKHSQTSGLGQQIKQTEHFGRGKAGEGVVIWQSQEQGTGDCWQREKRIELFVVIKPNKSSRVGSGRYF